MPASLDGRMNYRAWDQEPDQWSYSGPFSSFQEQQIQQALNSVHMTADEITTYVQAPLSQVKVFRPRMGYPEVQERQARVEDIVNVPRRLDARATWYSGTPAGMQGGSRYSSNNLGLT